MGTWYEIARMPAPFQKQCACSQADYDFNAEEGFVNVNNSCVTKNGQTQRAIGKAYSKNQDNTQLKVFFDPHFGGNYWILELGENYEYVLVGEPCKKFLWILSRTKTMDKDLLNRLITKAHDIGYKTQKLVYRDYDSC